MTYTRRGGVLNKGEPPVKISLPSSNKEEGITTHKAKRYSTIQLQLQEGSKDYAQCMR